MILSTHTFIIKHCEFENENPRVAGCGALAGAVTRHRPRWRQFYLETKWRLVGQWFALQPMSGFCPRPQIFCDIGHNLWCLLRRGHRALPRRYVKKEKAADETELDRWDEGVKSGWWDGLIINFQSYGLDLGINNYLTLIQLGFLLNFLV